MLLNYTRQSNCVPQIQNVLRRTINIFWGVTLNFSVNCHLDLFSVSFVLFIVPDGVCVRACVCACVHVCGRERACVRVCLRACMHSCVCADVYVNKMAITKRTSTICIPSRHFITDNFWAYIIY